MNTYPTQPPVAMSATAPTMKIIDCAIRGCNSKCETTEAVSPQVRYLCCHHSRKEHVAAVGRVFDPNTDEQDKTLRFQEHQFDKCFRRTKKRVGTSHIERQGNSTEHGDEFTELLFDKIAQSLPGRFSVETVTNYQNSRPGSPSWVKAQDLLTAFIKSRLTKKELEDLLQRKPPLWAALDYIIVTEYYLHYRTDEDIFEKYKHHLREEAEGKKRWTSSVNALKNRRIRLIEKGNAMFGLHDQRNESDGPHEADRNDEAA